MESKYIRLDYEQAFESKKQLLSSELNLLQTAKRVRNYKILRKKELTAKDKLRAVLKKLRTAINIIQSTFPEQEMPKIPKKSEKNIKKKQEQDIQEQLQEIQEKLERLS